MTPESEATVGFTGTVTTHSEAYCHIHLKSNVDLKVIIGVIKMKAITLQQYIKLKGMNVYHSLQRNTVSIWILVSIIVLNLIIFFFFLRIIKANANPD